jgi:hypothetical protein
MKKISLRVNSTPFNIDIEEDFAVHLLKAMRDDFNMDGNNDIKILLQAYVRKNYQLFENEKLLAKMTNAISDSMET